MINENECTWKYNEDEYYYETSCERVLMFAADGPTENGYLYCPFCGKKIHVEE